MGGTIFQKVVKVEKKQKGSENKDIKIKNKENKTKQKKRE
jgi:hypothetical protein